MTPTEPTQAAIVALAACALQDDRYVNPPRTLIESWTRVFMAPARWVTATEASWAVSEHYQATPEAQISAERVLGLVRARRAEDARRPRWAPAETMPSDEAFRERFRSVVCPVCNAQPGELCTNLSLGSPMARRNPGHYQRGALVQQ